MNRTTSIFLLLIGMLLFLGSCAPFGYTLYHELLIEPSQSYSLSGVGLSDKTSFNSSPGTLVRFTVEADVSTDSVQEDTEGYSDDYIARFKFPISYRISVANGNTLIHEDVSLAWKDGGSISKRDEETSSTNGTLTASTSFDKFTVPADGTFNIDIEVSPDTTYEANATSLKLHLYEGMLNNTWFIITGIIMLIVGFIMAMIGFIVIVTDAAKASSQSSTQEQLSDPNMASDGVQSNSDANQQAMIIQLSAFAGYIIPFGSIIVPIVLWQIWKDKDPYVERMGREAVNFQLSMLIDYIICVVLMFILIGFLLIFVVMIFHLTYIIIAAVQTSRGAEYRYPMIWRFIKS